jgi:hypothetical protein
MTGKLHNFAGHARTVRVEFCNASSLVPATNYDKNNSHFLFVELLAYPVYKMQRA